MWIFRDSVYVISSHRRREHSVLLPDTARAPDDQVTSVNSGSSSVTGSGCSAASVATVAQLPLFMRFMMRSRSLPNRGIERAGCLQGGGDDRDIVARLQKMIALSALDLGEMTGCRAARRS